MNRRQLLGAGLTAGAGAVLASAAAAETRFRDLPEAAFTDIPYTQVPDRPMTGLDYNPVVTLNGWSLPWRMNGNVKEFHLVAEPVEHAPPYAGHWRVNPVDLIAMNHDSFGEVRV